MKSISIILLVSLCLSCACRPTIFAKTVPSGANYAKQAMMPTETNDAEVTPQTTEPEVPASTDEPETPTPVAEPEAPETPVLIAPQQERTVEATVVGSTGLQANAEAALDQVDFLYDQKYLDSTLPPEDQRPTIHYGEVRADAKQCHVTVTDLGSCVSACSNRKCITSCVDKYEKTLREQTVIDWDEIIRVREERERRRIEEERIRMISNCKKVCEGYDDRCETICIESEGERIVKIKEYVKQQCTMTTTDFRSEIDLQTCQIKSERDFCYNECDWLPEEQADEKCTQNSQQFEEQCTTEGSVTTCRTLVRHQESCSYSYPRQSCDNQCTTTYNEAVREINRRITEWEIEQERLRLEEERRRQEELRRLEEERLRKLEEERQRQIKIREGCQISCREHKRFTLCFETCVETEGQKIIERLEEITHNCKQPSAGSSYEDIIGYRKCYADFDLRTCRQQCLIDYNDADAQQTCYTTCNDSYTIVIKRIEKSWDSYIEYTKKITNVDFEITEDVCPVPETCETEECLAEKLSKLRAAASSADDEARTKSNNGVGNGNGNDRAEIEATGTSTTTTGNPQENGAQTA